MSKVVFKLPMGIKVKCKVTGLTGMVIGRMQRINGSVQYTVQPPVKKNTNYLPDAFFVDEANLVTKENEKNEPVNFKFETGDRVKNRSNDFVGIVTARVQFQNGCIAYTLEGAMNMKENKEVNVRCWEQEAALVDKGLNAGVEVGEQPVKRARTGGPTERVPAQKAW